MIGTTGHSRRDVWLAMALVSSFQFPVSTPNPRARAVNYSHLEKSPARIFAPDKRPGLGSLFDLHHRGSIHGAVVG